MNNWWDFQIYWIILLPSKKPCKNLLAVKPFLPNAPPNYPLKTSENLRVFWCFQGIEKGALGTHVLMELLMVWWEVNPQWRNVYDQSFIKYSIFDDSGFNRRFFSTKANVNYPYKKDKTCFWLRNSSILKKLIKKNEGEGSFLYPLSILKKKKIIMCEWERVFWHQRIHLCLYFQWAILFIPGNSIPYKIITVSDKDNLWNYVSFKILSVKKRIWQEIFAKAEATTG